MGSPVRSMSATTETGFLLDVERALKSMSIFGQPVGSGELRVLFDRLRRADEAPLPVVDTEERKGTARD